ncbi:aconitate hydratase AcnA [Limibacillus halophilus]|uniref:Aconitate hydratase n=1 Tax=Limibacillus halophilus TaxID=1579333 RepID=A0A839STE8_9PROT|nr:aconitate hydratase AcnA [Limibacillus halophilus]MBB3066127.1 aconitate hydratase [Limibacillus halophilus]
MSSSRSAGNITVPWTSFLKERGGVVAVAKQDLGGDFGACRFVDLRRLQEAAISTLPYSLRILLENVARAEEEDSDAAAALEALLRWNGVPEDCTVPLRVARIVLPDSSGLPALMDLAALRDALAEEGLPIDGVEPVIPVDLIIDHSLIVDRAGTAEAAAYNERREYERNAERYRFFKWAQGAFKSLRVVPPGMGIIHQIHLERLSNVVGRASGPDGEVVFPEFVLGCDSHTPMVNALGLLAWGVGGIEAEAALLGRPYMVKLPRVVGVRLTGKMREGVTTTDLVLLVTEKLRSVGVVGDFVEYFGEAAAALTVPQRATLANMAPEYGATCGFFPIDGQTIAYLEQSGRSNEQIALVQEYAKASGLYREEDAPVPQYSAIIEIDVSEAEPCLAGPRRPQDRRSLSAAAADFNASLAKSKEDGGFAAASKSTATPHGTLAIAAITSCTNTSNPSVMLAAGLLARKARRMGLSVPGHVKTSLAPGSRVVTRYLAQSGLIDDLEALGFHVVGYGCTTCSGKSGEIAPALAAAAEEEGAVLAAILSGNRNFEARIHPQVRASYLASPPLVVAYALAGRINLDPQVEPLGQADNGQPVFLHDIWPSDAEVEALVAHVGRPELYRENYATLYEGTALWRDLEAPEGPLFAWPETSSYLLRPPFFDAAKETLERALPDSLLNVRALCLFGDSLTTDHVTPSGAISPSSLAGQYLADQGVKERDFNAYTQRRGNHEVLMRATFANPRIKNLMQGVREGGFTRKYPDGEEMPIFEAARQYRWERTPMIVLAGRDYGMGSSRDWAAKGPALLGVKAVIAESFERIHRSNLVGMGILPLAFEPGIGWRLLGLDGSEIFTLSGIATSVQSGNPVEVVAEKADGRVVTFTVRPVLAGDSERRLLEDGGIFASVLKDFLKSAAGGPDHHPNGGTAT